LKGNYETWAEEKLKKEKDEVVQNEKLTKDIKRLKEATKRTGEWSDRIEKSKMARGNGGEIPVDRGFVSHKASKMMKKSKSTQARQEKAMEAKKDLLLDVEVAPKLSMEPEQYHSKTLIRMKDIEISYGERVVLSDVSFDINRGECVALMGPNGSGKSSLFKLLLNEDIDYKGTLEVPESLKISYVQQDTSTLSGTLDEFVLSKGIDKTQFFTILRKLGFKRDVFEKRIEDYSQGQKKKVALAASLCSKAHLYLWDEPLNYLDVIAREQIEELIKEYQPTILLIEHDEEFINNIAQKVINL
ncbi:MAG: ATP-binding cassette domain-containing protein, partial [Erysipelotrichales bacterium]